jgi:very-short-patch-repair endonuclease
VLDFYCPAAGLSVEADGGIHDVESVARRDSERQQILEEVYGIRVVRFTNDEVLKGPEQVLNTIKAALREQLEEK